MSLDFTPTNPDTPPTKLRIMAVVIHNGVCTRGVNGSGEEAAQFSQPPFVELVIQGSDLMLDQQGTPMLNPLGLAAYDDRPGYMTSLRISDPASLVNFMGLWGSIMDGGEALLAEAIAAGRIRFSR